MKKTLLLIVLAFLSVRMFATNPPDEGMWLPMFIKNYNYSWATVSAPERWFPAMVLCSPTTTAAILQW